MAHNGHQNGLFIVFWLIYQRQKNGSLDLRFSCASQISAYYNKYLDKIYKPPYKEERFVLEHIMEVPDHSWWATLFLGLWQGSTS